MGGLWVQGYRKGVSERGIGKGYRKGDIGKGYRKRGIETEKMKNGSTILRGRRTAWYTKSVPGGSTD
jgi:hypothetical protein